VNVSSGKPVTLRALFTALAERLGNASVLGWGQRSPGAKDPEFVVGDNSVLRGLGWQRTFDEDQLVADLAAHWRSRLLS
jgi:nucleoside-diphosphate-sugar epimerase